MAGCNILIRWEFGCSASPGLIQMVVAIWTGMSWHESSERRPGKTFFESDFSSIPTSNVQQPG